MLVDPIGVVFIFTYTGIGFREVLPFQGCNEKTLAAAVLLDLADVNDTLLYLAMTELVEEKGAGWVPCVVLVEYSRYRSLALTFGNKNLRAMKG